MGFAKRLNQSAVVSVFCLVLVSACTEDADDVGKNDAATTSTSSTTLHGACDSSKRIGGFEVSVGPSTRFITGIVLAGVVPSTIQNEIADLGSCKLMRQNSTFCDPACEMNMDCDTNGQCIAHPASQNVGAVSITGLAQAVEMPAANTYFVSPLPATVVEPGASVQLRAAGGDISGFKLYGKGIKPLVVTDSVWNVAAAQATTISWEAASVSGATIVVSFGLDQHGTTPVQMVCEVEDTGSLVISAEQIKQLVDRGTGVPTEGTIKRRTVDSVQTSKGCIDFTVYSQSKTKVNFTP